LFVFSCIVLALAAPVAAQTPEHQGQIPQPVPLGVLVDQADPIAVLRVTNVQAEKAIVTYRQVAFLKGTDQDTEVRHHIHACDQVLQWARPGRTAICFYFGGKAVTCVGNHWYYNWNFGETFSNPGVWTCADWINGFTATYVGPVEKLREHVNAIRAGREVVVTAEAPGDLMARLGMPNPTGRDWLHGKKGRVWRIKAGTKVRDFVGSDTSPHFVAWGIGGAESVPSCLTALGDKDALVRAEALENLSWLGAEAQPALPALREALRDVDPYVRVYAAEALWRIDPKAEIDLHVLLEVLGGPKAGPRAAAASVLGSLGHRAEPAIPDLVAALRNDSHPHVRAVAAFVLGEIASGSGVRRAASEKVIAALADVLTKDEDDRLRMYAARALLHFGADAWKGVPALRGALRSNDQVGVAVVAADVLARLDPPPVQILAEALRDPVCGARPEVVDYLGEVGPQGRLAAPALRWLAQPQTRDLFFDQAHPQDPRLAKARARIEGARPTTIPLDTRARESDPEPEEDLSARLASTRSPEAAAALRRLLKPGSSAEAVARRRAARGFCDLLRKDHAEELLNWGDWVRTAQGYALSPEAEEAWEHEAAWVAHGVEHLVSRLDPDTSILPRLEKAMKDPDIHVRLAAIVALSRADRHHAAAAAALVKLLEERPGLFYYVADSLAEAGPRARPAVPWLLRALRHDNHAVYRTALRCLASIDARAADVWSARSLLGAGRAPAGPRTPRQWDALGEELGSLDAVRGYQAVWALALAGDASVPFLQRRVQPVPARTREELARLVARLDSDRFAERDRAASELEQLVDLAEPILRQTLAARPSLETRRRAEQILEKLDPTRSASRIRALRAVQILEQLATPRAREQLAALAEGAPTARLTQEAKAALQRLERRAAPVP
jgi:HEAT repeat protein